MAIVYPTFPRRLITGELSKFTRIVRQDFDWQRNAIVDRFDDGMWEATRSRGSGKLVDSISDLHTCTGADLTIVMAFLDSVEFGVKPFNYVHPFLGTVLVKLATDKQSVKWFIEGGTQWFQFTLQLRGVSG